MLVAGVDSSTQACKVLIVDADTGDVVREGRAPHPDGTEVAPVAWLDAFHAAARAAGGLEDVASIGIGGQQHGLVLLDESGVVVRPALLWNDTRSASEADALVAELGPSTWADAVGSVPVAAFTVTKLRWVAEHEPGLAARAAAVCLPHDWLRWQLAGPASLDTLVTDRGDASGTGYWSPASGDYRLDLLERAFGRVLHVPRVLDPLAVRPVARAAVADSSGMTRPVGHASAETGFSAGTGDNMAAALGLSLVPGDVVISIGTSGTVFAVSELPTADPSGAVAGFADATGHFLPLVCTLNAARVLTSVASMLGVDLATLDALALSADPGAEGVVLVPYFDGERTPNRPGARASLHGLTTANSTPANVARAAVEGLLCGLAEGLAALVEHGVAVGRILLIGGGSKSAAVRHIAPTVLGLPIEAPPEREYVAYGAARQAASALAGSFVTWQSGEPTQSYDASPAPQVREQYALTRG